MHNFYFFTQTSYVSTRKSWNHGMVGKLSVCKRVTHTESCSNLGMCYVKINPCKYISTLCNPFMQGWVKVPQILTMEALTPNYHLQFDM